MIKIFGLFIIVVAILLGLFIKVLWDLFLGKDGEKTTADNLIAAAVDVIIASLPSFFDSILQFLYDRTEREKNYILHLPSSIIHLHGLPYSTHRSKMKIV